MEWSDYIANSMPCQVAPVNGRPAVWLESGTILEHVAGEQYYQTQLAQIVGGRFLPLGGPAWLVPEDDNAYDDNAVRVVINEQKVGYLPRDRAALWQSVLKSLTRRHQCYVACMSQIVLLGNARQLDVVLYVPVHLSTAARDQFINEQNAAEQKRLHEAFEQARIKQAAERERQLAVAHEEEREARQQREAQLAANWAAEREANERKFNALVSRFGQDAARRIISREVWLGATREMIEEAHGTPSDVDEKVMKTKTRHVLKYRPTGANRFALRITLEDGVVVGWEGKG